MIFDEFDIKSLIRPVPDFPKPGVVFRDITPLFQSPRALRMVADSFIQRYVEAEFSHIGAMDARGFLIGATGLGVRLPPRGLGTFCLQHGGRPRHLDARFHCHGPVVLQAQLLVEHRQKEPLLRQHLLGGAFFLPQGHSPGAERREGFSGGCKLPLDLAMPRRKSGALFGQRGQFRALPGEIPGQLAMQLADRFVCHLG